MTKNMKLKRLCTQCVYFVPKGKTCKVNPELCKGINANACGSWKYKYRLDGKFHCEYLSAVVDSTYCDNCGVRCIRSESRKEQDYALQ